jgi:hypothetical protein
MILYHGTASSNVDSILSEGLKPRKNNLGNWFTNIKSNSELVYLTNTDECEHYALRSAIVNQDSSGVILQIDVDKLDHDLLRVDENFIDIEERGAFVNCNIEDRQKQREKAAYDNRWEQSLQVFGSCTYYGIVPPEAISVKEIKKIKDIRYFRDEFVEHSTPQANCYVYDAFLSNFSFHLDLNVWIDRENKSPVGRVYVDIESFRTKYENIVD